MLDRPRILFAPRPGLGNGPSIALLRLERALRSHGMASTSLPFRLSGHSLLPWQFAIMMGVPRHAERLFRCAKPVILIAGKPEDPLESSAVGRVFTAMDEKDNERRAEAIEKADYVAFISRYVVGIWQRWFQERGQTFRAGGNWDVVYHGVDLQQFQPNISMRPNAPFTIGCVGALRTRVRVDAIYEVSRRLSFPHRLLVIGSVTEECERRFSELQANESWKVQIERHRWMSADKLPAALHQMHCLLHPVDYEGFGNVLAEAMACGVPVVAPMHGAAAEIIPPGGVVVKTVQFRYDDEFFSLLAGGIEIVNRDLQEFSVRARAVALERFDIAKIARRFLDIANHVQNRV